jgi:serralysin
MPTEDLPPDWVLPLGPPNNFLVSDQSNNTLWQTQGNQYSGPVATLTQEVILATTDNINVVAKIPNVFIKTESGQDAIQVRSGINVVDGGTGSNYLTAGSGFDTFFVDDRNPSSDIWSTIVGAKSHDNITIWGLTPTDFNISWINGEGVPGSSGLTLHATADSKPEASLTLAGFTTNDLTNGKLVVTTGVTNDSPNAMGSSYLNIHVV